MGGRARSAAIASLLALATIGTSAGARQQPDQPPLFRAATDLVEVDVVVHDEHGRFVADLKPDEFEVREEGQPQRIEIFTVAGQPASIPAPAAATAGIPGAPAQPVPRLFLAVFDTDHLTPGGFHRAQTAAISLFSNQFRSGDVGGIVANGQIANRRLTSDREELLASIRRAKPTSKTASRLFDERQWPRVSEAEAIRIVVNDDRALLDELVRRACADDQTLCDKAELAVRGKTRQMVTEIRATIDRTLRTVMSLLTGLSRIDGRKTVLLFSEGFVAEESWPLVQQAIDLAARANARVYTLDARGLDRGLRNAQDADPGGADGLARVLAQLDPGSDPINSLAVDTGGFVVRNANLFDEAIERIARDASTYYVLGFRPAAPPDNTFHRISVTVRRPGVVSRARRGYIAVRRSAPTPAPATAPAASAEEPPPPAPVPAAPPVVSGAGAPAAPANRPTADGLRLRPDAAKHLEALDASRSSADPDAQRGWTAYERGDVESARAALAVAAKRPAARPWVHYALGLSHYALRRYRDAIPQWEDVRSSTPEFEPVYFDLADAYLQVADADNAIRVLRAARQRWPADAEVSNALGVAQVVRGALDDAIHSFEQAVAAAPADGVGYFNLAKALELRYVRSRRYIQQTGTWIANSNDRANALANYERYLTIGGALESAAREGISRLNWTPGR